MFCPRCGSTQSDDIRFCKACGANLGAVRRAVDSKGSGKFDWKETWISEMMLPSEEAVRRAAEIERIQGITPEVKRRNEIKAGVITASVGIGVMIFLYLFMQGIVLSGQVEPGEEQILLRIWIAGVIPFLVGVALIINGAFVSKMFHGSERRDESPKTGELPGKGTGEYLPPAETAELFPADFSVTDETTAHLKEPIRGPAKSEGNR